MLLAIDARNSSVSVGFREGGAWLAKRVYGAVAGRSADEYALFLSMAAAEAGGSVERAILSSVVPSLTPRLVAAVSRSFGIDTLVVGPGVRTGLKIRSELPQELGSDIVCAAVAAKSLLAGRPCVVVDFGDALVFSALNAAGDFLGAAIAPGLEAAAQSLHRSAALLPAVRAETPAAAIGKTTQAAIQSGLHFGYIGLIQGLVARFRGELATAEVPADAIEVVATGDPAGRELLGTVAPRVWVDDLALEGLALVAARAVGEG
jgi:type III pantothenate kinase